MTPTLTISAPVATAPIAHRGDFAGFGVDVGCIELTAEGKRKVAAGYRRAAKRVTGMESAFDRDGTLQVTAPSVRYFKIGSISGRTEVCCEGLVPRT